MLGASDRISLYLSSLMAEPFCFAWECLRYRLAAPLSPAQFDNSASRCTEIGKRSLIALGATLGAGACVFAPLPMLGSLAALGIGSRLFRALGFALQDNGFTHVSGNAPEKSFDGSVKVTTWNICGMCGGMHFDHGGVIDWRARLDRIIAKIIDEDPDVLILQEVYDTALAEALIKKLGPRYAHFFAHLGPNSWGSVGGLMVATKGAVHHFSHTSFDNNSWTLNRGFATLELKSHPKATEAFVRIIGTHFIHGNTRMDSIRRVQQMSQIARSLMIKQAPLPTILAGDLNQERECEGDEDLTAYVTHGYVDPEPTCTNRLTEQWDGKARSVPSETIDYISLFNCSIPYYDRYLYVRDKNVRMTDCHLIRAFDATYNTKTALSDHHGLSATIQTQ